MADEVEGTEVEDFQFDFENYGLEDEPANTEVTQPTETEDSEENESGYPSTWNPILEKLPKEFHNLVAPELKKWDQGVNERFQTAAEKHKPWKQFEDAGIAPDSLRNAYMIAQRMEDDPTQFLEDLKATLIERGMYQEAAQVQKEIDDSETVEDPYDQRLNQIAEQQRLMQEALVNAQQTAMQERRAVEAAAQVQEEYSALEAKVGRLDPRTKIEIANRAVLMSQRHGRDVSIEEAFQDLAAYMSNVRKASPGARAPRVSPGGGIPVANDVDLSTPEGREINNRRIMQRLGIDT